MTLDVIADTGADDGGATAADTTQAIARLVRRAIVALLQSTVGGDERAGDEALAELDDVRRTLAALLETVDPATIAAAVDPERLLMLVDWSGVPEALSTGDYRSVIAYENIPEFLDAPALLDATDVREGWRQSRDLSETVGDLADRVVGPETDDAAAADPETEEERAVEAANDAKERDAGIEVAKSLSTTDKGRRFLVQKAVSDAVEDAREEILDAHDRIDAAVADVDERVGRVGRPNSRNPTAFSTLPRSRARVGRATTYSTVPTETRYSDAPNFERIYGPRFDRRDET
ncbi:ELKS/Rab6-interacting/CAST family protein [Halomarina rubra]|uniref:Uncharacterized protein n=1 Tax=Halomarina rubra TaxID=2071873 RepID=A0ABD6AYF2_9EURY|nr:ELKS/Rab6-interacting/CAST family protein [Halomarina rubra]